MNLSDIIKLILDQLLKNNPDALVDLVVGIVKLLFGIDLSGDRDQIVAAIKDTQPK